jgi:hypothetical protein
MQINNSVFLGFCFIYVGLIAFGACSDHGTGTYFLHRGLPDHITIVECIAAESFARLNQMDIG